MIEISEPLPESEQGLTTIHDIFLDGKRIGHIEVTYLQKDDVKAFKKYAKRKLFAGQPYGTRIFIDAKGTQVTADKLGKSGLSEIVAAVKEKFKGLEDRDIYLLELTDAGKKIICRASEL
jgi:hypothetical protein